MAEEAVLIMHLMNLYSQLFFLSPCPPNSETGMQTVHLRKGVLLLTSSSSFDLEKLQVTHQKAGNLRLEMASYSIAHRSA